MIIIYQKLKSHKHTQTRPGTRWPLALPPPAQGVGTLNSLALRQNLSSQLPGATWCLTPATQALFSWGINATGKGYAVGFSLRYSVLQGKPGAALPGSPPLDG